MSYVWLTCDGNKKVEEGHHLKVNDLTEEKIKIMESIIGFINMTDNKIWNLKIDNEIEISPRNASPNQIIDRDFNQSSKYLYITHTKTKLNLSVSVKNIENYILIRNILKLLNKCEGETIYRLVKN